jgi:hypothetical protein
MLRVRPLPKSATYPSMARPLLWRKNMSIAAAIMCADGIVLCADSQETIDQYFKVHKPKLIELPLVSPDLKAVVVGAGDGMFMDILIERISEKIDLAIPNSGAIQTAIDVAVKEICSSNWPLYAAQNDRPQARLLVGVKAVDGLFLFDVSTPMVRSADRYTFIGCGYDLALYKAKQLFRPELPAEIAAKLLIHILDIVKENVEFCGGDTHLAIITPNGAVDHKTSEYVENAAKGYKRFSQGMDCVSALLSLLPAQGTDALTAISNLPEPAIRELESAIANAIQQKQGIGQIVESPEMVLATFSQQLATFTGALQNTVTKLDERGLLPKDTTRKLQQLFLELATSGVRSAEEIKAGNLEKAAEYLVSTLVRLPPDLNLPLTSQTLEGQQ